MFYRKTKKGFTLIELICVIAIMAVLGSIVGIGVGAIIRKNSEKNCKTELEAYFTTSQNMVQAINNGRGRLKLSEYAIWVKKCKDDSTFQNRSIESEFQQKISPDNYGYLHFYFLESSAPRLGVSEDGLYLRLDLMSEDKYLKIAKMYLVKKNAIYEMNYNTTTKIWSSAKK